MYPLLQATACFKNMTLALSELSITLNILFSYHATFKAAIFIFIKFNEIHDQRIATIFRAFP